MRRREFITLIGGAAAWPPSARAQQAAMPVVVFLEMRSPDENSIRISAFLHGLNETGFVDGRDFVLQDRAAPDLDSLRMLATDLVHRNVAVICGPAPSAIVAKAATNTIPIVFITVGDPVAEGLVKSYSHPGGNVTGVRLRAGEEPTKLLEILHEFLPTATSIGVLIYAGSATVEQDLAQIATAARSLNLKIIVERVGNGSDFDVVFTNLSRAKVGALLINPARAFDGRHKQFGTLAVRNALPTITNDREFPIAGGLASYGPNVNDSVRQAGNYVGRILKGAKPADLPVVQPTKFDLVINLKTAKALGLTIPPTLLARADEVIE